MKDKENYVLLINSQNATNRIGTTKKQLQFYVNWNVILPKPTDINQKYKVRFNFSGINQPAYSDIWSINIDFGGSNVYQQDNNKCTYLGLSYPIGNQNATTAGTNSVNFFTKALLNDNPPITIEYPNNNLITVNILNINAGSGTTFNVEYYLTLEFTPI